MQNRPLYCIILHCGALRCGALWCGVVRCGDVRCIVDIKHVTLHTSNTYRTEIVTTEYMHIIKIINKYNRYNTYLFGSKSKTVATRCVVSDT